MAVGPGLRGYDGDNTNRNPSLVGCYGLGLDECLSLAHMQRAESGFRRRGQFARHGVSYMSFGSDVGEEREDLENERQAVMMEDRLHKDVASWSKERREQPREHATGSKQTVVKNGPSPQAAGRSKGPIASGRAIKPAAAHSKPFSMSYDGMTEAQYIQYRLDRGAR